MPSPITAPRRVSSPTFMSSGGKWATCCGRLRRWSEAVYALEGAATLLVRAGELRAASELVPAVARIDPEAAYRVQQLLWTAAQGQSG